MKQPIYLLILAGMVVLLAGGAWLYDNISHEAVSLVTPEPTRLHIQVQIRGAVVHPGVYDLDEDSRILQAVAAAGGFAPGADTHINLAAHIYDGQRLEIPYRGQVKSTVLSSTTPSALTGYDVMKDLPAGTGVVDVNPVPSPTSTLGNFSCSDAAVGSGVFVWPADAHFLSGNDFSYEHPGLDIAAGMGSPVYAADSGFVRSTGNDPSGYGNVIEIDHGNGYSTVYAHLSTIEVGICQSVNAGQRIGSAGDTGNADGAHLHFEVIEDGVYINPWSVLPSP